MSRKHGTRLVVCIRENGLTTFLFVAPKQCGTGRMHPERAKRSSPLNASDTELCSQGIITRIQLCHHRSVRNYFAIDAQ
jgi:hypothetical protein